MFVMRQETFAQIVGKEEGLFRIAVDNMCYEIYLVPQRCNSSGVRGAWILQKDISNILILKILVPEIFMVRPSIQLASLSRTERAQVHTKGHDGSCIVNLP